MSASPFAAPATASGIKWADLKGSLVLVEVLAAEKGIQTAFGDTDAVRANVAVLDGDQKGETYPDCLIFPKALQGQLRPRVGAKVLGRVTQGAAKAGQSAPWLLAEATPDDEKLGLAFLAGDMKPATDNSDAKGDDQPPW